jgi:hypothetical protein
MIGVGLGFLGFGLALLPFRESLAVAVEPRGHGQGKDLGGGPERVDDENAEDDPVMPPSDQWFLTAGNEWVVVHAGAVEGQSSSPRERVVDGPKERGARCEDGDGEGVEAPSGVAEEAMEAAPVSIADIAAGEDELGQ